jgi:ribonuclease HI
MKILKTTKGLSLTILKKDNQMNQIKNYKIEIYTDGSCLKNPGVGAFAFLIIDHFSKNLYIMSKFYESTTNNQMEMLSCVFALRFYLSRIHLESTHAKNILILTDSQYLKNGINDWIFKWKKNNWKTASNEPVKNQEIWMNIDDLNQKIKPDWLHVKAHAQNPYNNFVDKLANLTAKNSRKCSNFEIDEIFCEFFKPTNSENFLINFKKNLIETD